jgi:murein DD-endopeptidase MepM/ murein hydrolase activator NlpD
MGVLASQNVKRKKSKTKYIYIASAIGFFILIFFVFQKKDSSKTLNKETPITKEVVQESKAILPDGDKKEEILTQNTYKTLLENSIKSVEERPDLITIENHVTKEPLAKTLQDLSIDPNEVYALVNSMKLGGYDFGKTKPNERFIVKTDDKGKIWEFYIFPSKLTFYYTSREENILSTIKVDKVLKEEMRLVKGVIKDSLYNSVIELNEHPNLVIELADFVFKGGEIDFFSDCQEGDKYAIKVPRKYYVDMRGEKVYTNFYGEVEAVYYKGRTVGNVYAFKYLEKKDQLPDYYNEEAKAVKRPFLRIPFTFRVGISSGFGMRRDPVSRAFNRNHNGTDFPVRSGTPFISPAKGRIIKMGYQANGAGKWFRMRHANGYFTEYFHLSQIKKGLVVGSVVKQGELLGKTGNSGRSTGPHLHYGMMKACSKCPKGFQYVNAMTQKFTISTKEMPKDKKPSYFKMIKPLKEELDKAINSL